MARELVLEFREHFANGLRPSTRVPRNAPTFDQLDHVRVRPEGIVTFETVTQPVSNTELAAKGITLAFPYPQLFRGKGVTLLLTQTNLYLIDETTWLLTLLPTYDLYSPASTKAITSGSTWHFADFWTSFMLYNGSCSIYKFANDAKYYVQDTVGIQTGCAHRGRLIQGGFNVSNHWSAAWKTQLQGWITQDNPPNSSILKTLVDIGPNWIWWSTIGGGDIRILHDPSTFSITGPLAVGHDSSNPYVWDLMLRNEWGWMPMQFQGTVKCVRSLGQHLAVFGTDGIEFLTQYSSPTPTFGSTLSLPFGIAGRSAVGGDGNTLIFLDNDGCLWSVDSSLKLMRLDYTEFFNPMLGTDIVVTYNPQERDFFISNTNDAYTLSRDGGLSKSPQKLTSLEWAGGAPVGFFTSEATSDFLAVSSPFDMGYGGMKQIHSIELGGSPEDSIKVAMDYRYDRDAAWSRTSFMPINKEGNAHILISGNEFRLVLKRASSYSNIEVDYVLLKWKPTDRRFRRAISGPQG